MKNQLAIFLFTISVLANSAALTAQDISKALSDEVERKASAQSIQNKNTEAQHGVAPVNDNYAFAQPIVVGLADTITITGDNTQATKEVNEPDHADNSGGRSLWYTLTSPTSKVVEIRTISPATTFDTTLAVYKGELLPFLKPLVSNDDCYSAECTTRSRVRLKMEAGVVYRMAVDGYNGGVATAAGSFTLTIDQQQVAYEFDDIETAYDLGTITKASIGATNHFGTGQPGEPAHSEGTIGNKSVWYRFRVLNTRAMTASVKEDFMNEIAVYQSSVPNPTFEQLTKLDDSNDHTGFGGDLSECTFMAYSAYYYFVALDYDENGNGDGSTGNFQLRLTPTKMRYGMRISRWDAFSSMTVFRPQNGTWYSLTADNPASAQYRDFGLASDNPVPADYNGDDISDIAVTRNSNGLKHWYFLHQNGNQANYSTIQWGLSSDKEIVGDFDRDGRADPTVLRNQNGNLVWYVRLSLTGGLRNFVFGLPNDRPVLGDFDGDGATEVAVVRDTPLGLVWYMLMSNNNLGYSQLKVVTHGLAGDLPAVQDFDGDGKSDIASFRQSNGTWYILRSGSGQLQVTPFGLPNDVPQPADFDNDGKSELVLFRPATGVWYVWYSSNNTQKAVAWGQPGDKPLASMNRFSLPDSDE